MAEQRFEFPFVHPSVNRWSRTHWAVREKQKNKLIETAKAIIKASGGFVFPGPVEVYITLVFKDQRKRDIDNYSCKWLIDALKDDVFTDDNSEVVKALHIRFEVDKANGGRSEVVVKEVA